jgi:ribonuclease P protein component
MLSRINRVKKTKEFNYIYKKGKFYSCKYFSVHYVDTKLPNAKVGISVSHKVGNSVTRSKLKRIISEIVRVKLNILAVKNYVITLKAEAVSVDFRILNDEFNKFLIKCDLVKDTKDV